jgi:aminoglycoside phosphotransferase (APT) family kinase protein
VEEEIELSGGRVTQGVVRIGSTVRRPMGSHSPFVHELLALLEDAAFDCAPRFHGIDEQGREILDYHEGWVPPDLEGRRWEDPQLVAVARLVRSLHDASAGSALAGSAEVVCHGDLSPCNFVLVENVPRYVIDFDRARPGTRASDLAYMAWHWLVGREDPAESPPLNDRLRQLRLVLDTYGLGVRSGFAATIEAQQREVLAGHEQRSFAEGISWVRDEIAYVRAHAAEIDAAAG